MTSPLRIAFISLHTSPADLPGSADAGGMNVVERHLAAALAARGHRVDIYTRRAGDGATTCELEPGVSLHQVTAGPTTPLPKSEIDAHIDEFAANLAGELAGCDIVHSHHWMSGMAGLPWAREHGVPHVQSFHSIAAPADSELHLGEPPESPARVPGEAWLSQNSNRIIAVSVAEAATAVERCGADRARVQIVSPGVDLQMFHPGAVANLAPEVDHRGYAVFAARLQPLKGPDLALAAWAQVAAKLVPHLVIVGETSQDFAWYRAELDRFVAEQNLDGLVTFVGAQKPAVLAGLLAGARLAVIPSYSETFGLVALEAAACGTPVVAAASGGLVEAVVDGQTGRLFSHRDPERWGREITCLLADADELANMGRRGRMHASRFTWDAAAWRTEQIYRAAIGELA